MGRALPGEAGATGEARTARLDGLVSIHTWPGRRPPVRLLGAGVSRPSGRSEAAVAAGPRVGSPPAPARPPGALLPARLPEPATAFRRAAVPSGPAARPWPRAVPRALTP